MKRQLAILMLSAAILLSATVISDFSTYTVSAETSGDFTYRLINGNAEVEITGYTGGGGNVIIPGTIDGRPVTSISSYAFAWCYSLTSVTIPASVTTIGDDAFWNCYRMTSVTIGNSVTAIGSDAFGACHSLTSINVDPNNPKYSSYEGVLHNKDRTTLIQCPEGKSGGFTIPNSVRTISDYAFYQCSSLTSVTIGNNVTSIGDYAFHYCPSLTDIAVGPGNPTYASIDGILYNKSYTMLIQCPGGKSGEVAIPNSVTSIGSYAFYQCSSLTSVTIGNNVISIGDSAFRDCTALTSVAIPDSVTSIGSQAFYDCDSLASLTIGNNVTTIGSSAFSGCSKLASVIIGNGVTTIGDYAFSYCTALTSITIPASVASVGSWTFSSCSALVSINVDPGNPNYAGLNGVLYNKNCTTLVRCPEGKSGDFTIPNSVTSIGMGAVYRCSSLTSITIPAGVTTIGSYCFQYCSKLTSITIPDSVTTIGDHAFSFCSSLTSIDVDPDNPAYSGLDGVLYNKAGTELIKCPGGKIGGVTISGSVTSIRSSAFSHCVALTSVTIGNGVTSIDSWTFDECPSLTAMIFNGNAPSVVGSWASGCYKLTVYYHEGASGFTTPAWNGIPCYPLGLTPTAPNGLIATPGNGNVTLSWLPPSYIGSSDIGYYIVYKDGVEVKQVTGTSVTISGLVNGQSHVFNVSARNSFGNGLNATVAAVPNLISDDLIYRLISDGNEVEITGYIGLGGNVVIPNIIDGRPVTGIGDSAFRGRTALTSVTIPDSATTVGRSAFYGCTALINITVDPGNPNYASIDGVLYSKDLKTLILCPEGMSGSFKVPKGVTTIGERAFSSCSKLTSVTISDSVATIDNYSFSSCSSLTSITIPDSVVTIGSYAFQYCTSLTSVSIGNNVTSIGDYALQYCSSLTSITIPDSVVTIGESAFSGCDSLTAITIPDSVTTICSHAFISCSKLTSLTLGNGVTYIGHQAFAYTALTAITIPDSVTAIDGWAFSGCTALTSVVIGSGVTSIINSNTFEGCTALTSIIVDPDNSEYSSLDGVLYSKDHTTLIQCPEGKSGEFTIPDGVKTIDNYAFEGCRALTSTTIPDSVTDIGWRAFSGCSALTTMIFNGDAPSMGYDGWAYGNDQLTIYYYEGAAGFTTPTWNGIPCYQLDTPIPGSPRNFVATPGDTQVTLSWSAPTNVGDSSIDHYVVYMDGSKYGEFTSTSATITGLTNGQSYTFKVAAHNSFGNGLNATVTAVPTSVSGDFTCRLINNEKEMEIVRYVGLGGAVTIPSIIDGKPVTRIGDDAFRGCRNLTSVTIPDSVTTIGTSAFSDCASLTAINVDPDNPNYAGLEGVLYNKDVTTLIQFPGGKGGEFTIPDSVTTIGDDAFQGCPSLTTIKIPGTVTTIVSFDFTSCTALTTIMFQGNAPSLTGGYSYAYGELVMLVIYYYEGATGFDTSPWTSMSCYPLGSMPTAPNGLTVTPGNRNVILSWSPPSYAGDSAIDRYIVYVDGIMYGEFIETSLVITGLTNGQSYTFKVAAHNSFGNGLNATVTAVPAAKVTVTNYSPVGDEESTRTTITITFSEAMNKTSVSIVVNGVAGKITWNGNTAVFAPSAALKGNTEYTVTVIGKDLAGNELEEMTWTFTTGDFATVTGVVEDEDGKPVEGAKVKLGTKSTTADEDGRYFFYDVPKGEYTLTIEKDGYQTVTKKVKVTSKTVASGTATVDATLSKGSGSGDGTLLIAGVVAAIIVAALVGVLYMRRRA